VHRSHTPATSAAAAAIPAAVAAAGPVTAPDTDTDTDTDADADADAAAVAVAAAPDLRMKFAFPLSDDHTMLLLKSLNLSQQITFTPSDNHNILANFFPLRLKGENIRSAH
jgi:hypothetical protein